MYSCLSRIRSCGRQMLASQKELHRNAIEMFDIVLSQCVSHLFLFSSLFLCGLDSLYATYCLSMEAKIAIRAVVN